MDNKKVVILGDGGWGTALAMVLCRKGINPVIWGAFPDYLKSMEATRKNEKYLSGIDLPSNLSFESDLRKVVTESDVIVTVIPTVHLRNVLSQLEGVDITDKVFVSCTKGIEKDSLKTPTGVICEVLGEINYVVLSGPSHAEEVAKAIPTCVVTASKNEELAAEIQSMFMEENFRVYRSGDVAGVEMGGAIKNVIGIAAGICDGLGYGANTKSALLSRGAVELQRLGVALGASSETIFGLSGMGDLMTTCFSPHGRNRMVGERLGKGEKIDEIIASMEMVAEGVNTTESAYQLAKREKVEMPIIEEVYKVLYQGKDPKESISDLMMRSSKSEQ